MRLAASSIACGFPANGASHGSAARTDGLKENWNRMIGTTIRVGFMRITRPRRDYSRKVTTKVAGQFWQPAGTRLTDPRRFCKDEDLPILAAGLNAIEEILQRCGCERLPRIKSYAGALRPNYWKKITSGAGPRVSCRLKDRKLLRSSLSNPRWARRLVPQAASFPTFPERPRLLVPGFTKCKIPPKSSSFPDSYAEPAKSLAPRVDLFLNYETNHHSESLICDCLVPQPPSPPPYSKGLDPFVEVTHSHAVLQSDACETHQCSEVER